MENKSLSKNSQLIKDSLLSKGLNCKVIELEERTGTAREAASAIGSQIGQIVKSLIFKTEYNNQPILILVSGPNKLNETFIEKELGHKIVKADANFAKEVTGFAIGGIPPICHLQQIQTFIDRDLLKFDELWAAAGTPNSVFNITSKDLQDITNGKVIQIC